ncbi:MAG TPA: hypothetical protein VLA12_03350 [Planctomycetaceae bacterium]|nr:hypothetical protein [Planctomycetaceae bacterium]
MSLAAELTRIIRSVPFDPEKTASKSQLIAQTLCATSQWIDKPNFDCFHPRDLELLFDLYDGLFFDNQLRLSLGETLLSFQLSNRMTSRGGKTARYGDRHTGRLLKYEITISSALMYETRFEQGERSLVTGIECLTRLEALQRVFEHELIHLIEMILFQNSSCAQPQFQSIAFRFFGHTDHRHQMMTPRQRARTDFGIRAGMMVRFEYADQQFEGLVNRVTKRATVLVEDPEGLPYSDGKRYQKYYIPVDQLEPVELSEHHPNR